MSQSAASSVLVRLVSVSFTVLVAALAAAHLAALFEAFKAKSELR